MCYIHKLGTFVFRTGILPWNLKVWYSWCCLILSQQETTGSDGFEWSSYWVCVKFEKWMLCDSNPLLASMSSSAGLDGVYWSCCCEVCTSSVRINHFVKSMVSWKSFRIYINIPVACSGAPVAVWCSLEQSSLDKVEIGWAVLKINRDWIKWLMLNEVIAGYVDINRNRSCSKWSFQINRFVLMLCLALQMLQVYKCDNVWLFRKL